MRCGSLSGAGRAKRQLSGNRFSRFSHLLWGATYRIRVFAAHKVCTSFKQRREQAPRTRPENWDLGPGKVWRPPRSSVEPLPQEKFNTARNSDAAKCAPPCSERGDHRRGRPFQSPSRYEVRQSWLINEASRTTRRVGSKNSCYAATSHHRLHRASSDSLMQRCYFGNRTFPARQALTDD
jgi:hypothetical protein